MPDPENNRPAARGVRVWIAVGAVVVVLIAASIALLVVGTDSANDDRGETSGARAGGRTVYPTPPPFTFIPPTPLPPTPAPTLPPPPEGVIGAPLPDVVLPLLEGGSVHLPDLAGRIVIVNFWATWCEPCQEEMPLLQAVHETRDDVIVIGITNPDEGQSPAQIEVFVERYGITFPVALVTDGALFQYFAVAGIPVTYITDRDGIVWLRHLGELHDHDLDVYLSELES